MADNTSNAYKAIKELLINRSGWCTQQSNNNQSITYLNVMGSGQNINLRFVDSAGPTLDCQAARRGRCAQGAEGAQ
jgi:hypothetical protein